MCFRCICAYMMRAWMEIRLYTSWFCNPNFDLYRLPLVSTITIFNASWNGKKPFLCISFWFFSHIISPIIYCILFSCDIKYLNGIFIWSGLRGAKNVLCVCNPFILRTETGNTRIDMMIWHQNHVFFYFLSLRVLNC